MFNAHFGFSDSPFENNLDQRFLFLSQDHEEVLSALFYFIHEDKAFTLLCGDVGTGKTMLVHSFLEKLPSSVIPIIISNPQFEYHEILLFVAGYLGIEDHSKSSLALAGEIKEALMETRAQGQKYVLIIDEAHLLSDENLEHIRLLSNIETSEKLLQILLVGQYELSYKLERPEMRQLRQRISINRFLSPMDFSETIEYIDYRLKIVGSSFEACFDQGCDRLIYKLTNGVPRLVNQVCDSALLVCKIEGRAKVDKKILQKAHETLRSDILFTPRSANVRTKRPTSFLNSLTSLSVIAACLVFIIYMSLQIYPKFFSSQTVQTESQPSLVHKPQISVNSREPQPMEIETNTLKEPEPRSMESGVNTFTEPEPSQVIAEVESFSEMEDNAPEEESISQIATSLSSQVVVENRDREEVMEMPYQEIVVENGESLLELAHRYYGKKRRLGMKIILEANPDVTDKDKIYAGQILRLPIIDLDDDATSENNESIVP